MARRSAGVDGRTSTRSVNFADIRFHGNELRQARVASLDLANLDRTRRQMNLTGGGDQTLWIVVGVVAAAPSPASSSGNASTTTTNTLN